MTIIVKRRQKKETRLGPVFRAARKFAENKLANTHKLLQSEWEKENRRRADAIRRYARKHCLELVFHRKPWIFYGKNGEKVEMSAGYHAWTDGVLQIVVTT